MNISDTIQTRQFQFHKRRIFETKLYSIISIAAALMVITIWHVCLTHNLKQHSQQILIPAQITISNTRAKLVQQYSEAILTRNSANNCVKNLFNELNRIFPANLVLTSIKKSDDIISLQGKALFLTDITLWLRSLSNLKSINFQLQEIKKTNDNKSEFTIELRCAT